MTERTNKASDFQSPNYEFVDWQSSAKLNKKSKKIEDNSVNNSPNKHKQKNSKSLIDLPFSQATPASDLDLFNQTTIFKNNETKKHFSL